MRLAFQAAAAIATCLALCACATPQQRAERREDLLAAAGFTTRPANTPERIASLHRLPANKIVQRTLGVAGSQGHRRLPVVREWELHLS